MQRHEQIIQLSDHVKNKLKQYQYPPATSSFVNSSDEFIEVNSSIDDDDDDNESDSARDTSSDNLTRPRRDTYTIYEVKQSSGPFFTDRKSTQNRNTSILQEKYKKQQECEECLRRDHIIHHERRDLQYLYNQNKKLTNQLRSYILLNHQYKDDIQKLKYHLTKVNSHLNEYQINYDHLKQKIVYDKKPNPKIDEEEEEEEQDTQDDTDHIKRLRYEIQMYNRIVAAKQKQEEKTEQNQFDFLF